MVHHNDRFYKIETTLEFKYILCYGSSIVGMAAEQYVADLNTSYVMVHLYIAVSNYIWFSFKYILCYGSSTVSVSGPSNVKYLNTSYVMVHHSLKIA